MTSLKKKEWLDIKKSKSKLHMTQWGVLMYSQKKTHHVVVIQRPRDSDESLIVVEKLFYNNLTFMFK